VNYSILALAFSYYQENIENLFILGASIFLLSKLQRKMNSAALADGGSNTGMHACHVKTFNRVRL
jgi:hypothetical protein